MSETPIDSGKRTWLIASGCAGAVGGVAAAVPFVSTFQPSEKAKAAGAAVEVDISSLKPGEKITVEWRGKPVWIVKRTPEQLAELPKLDGQLADPASKRNPAELTPEYARNEWRSIKPEILVAALERFLAEVRDATGTDRVVLVGQSFGGVIIRDLLRDTAADVRAATPSHAAHKAASAVVTDKRGRIGTSRPAAVSCRKVSLRASPSRARRPSSATGR